MDEDDALTALFVQLADAGPAQLVGFLDNVAEEDEEQIVPTARRLAFSSSPDLAEISDLALSWLARRGRLEPGACDIARLLGAHLDSAVALAAGTDASTEVVTEAVAMDQAGERHVDEQLQLVRAVAARGLPGAEQVLEIVGRDHPDERVGRAARKELFKLRTLATE